MKRFQLLIILSFMIALSACQQHTKNETSDSENSENQMDDVTTQAEKVDVKQEEIPPVNINEHTSYFIAESLPDWVIEANLISDNKIKNKYIIDTRLNPFYLEEDFNGDGFLDIALTIKDITTNKSGFLILHGDTKDIHIIAAGKMIKNALSDDMAYIDMWKINREKENTGTDVDDNGDLIETPVLLLNSPSINILKSEVGGGIIFWNGNAYEYLHQTC